MRAELLLARLGRTRPQGGILLRVYDAALNAALLAIGWAAYSAVRSGVDEAPAEALANARAVIEFEQWIGANIEHVAQALIDSPAWYTAANVYYLLHFPITIGALAWIFLRDRHDTFVVFRSALIVATGIALVVHAIYPLAPPRMLDGFVDTGVVFGPNPYSLPGSDVANQFAAMPSMHAGWALLVGLSLLRSAKVRSSLVRVAAIGHPVITTIVVIVTANHYVIDVVAGWAIASVAWFVAVLGWSGRASDCVPSEELEAHERIEHHRERVGAALS